MTNPLDSIRVLYRAPDTLALYGIPYDMRPGQSPKDIWEFRDHPVHGWFWLGQPGWWGSMAAEKRTEVKAFLEKHADYIPENPCEWCRLP